MNRQANPRSRFEEIPPEEQAERREVAKITAQLQQKRKAVPSNKGEILRGVHPKSHGCVDATFTVNPDIKRQHRVGLFREPGKTFKAKIRYSNADVLILPDLIDGVNRSRGMAIKIMDAGDKAIVDDNGAVNQDFLMINTPEFAFANVRDYLRLSRVLLLDQNGASPDLFFAPLELAQNRLLDPGTGKLAPAPSGQPDPIAHLRPLFGPGGPFEDFGPADFQRTALSFGIVQKIQSQMVRNPIEVPYFGASAFRFGRGRVMRISVVPVDAPEQVPFTAEQLPNVDPDFLAHALEIKLKETEVRLRFRIQVAKIDAIQDRIGDLIENAAMSWDEAEFPPADVAEIVVPKITPGTPFVDACKGEFFTPWHTLAVHRPLGGINRLRRPVYNRSATKRLRKSAKV